MLQNEDSTATGGWAMRAFTEHYHPEFFMVLRSYERSASACTQRAMFGRESSVMHRQRDPDAQERAFLRCPELEFRFLPDTVIVPQHIIELVVKRD